MASFIPDTQRAWINVSKGTPAQALVFKQDWPVPKQLAPGQVLVRVQAAALNPVGYKLFKLLPNFIAGRPRVAEFDLSGVVADANDSSFSNGDAVFGWVPSGNFRKTDQGALAQYVKVSADSLVKCPANVTPIESAGFTLAGLTAYDAIIKKANIQRGQSIFINGGSTSVGAYAIQLAKLKGARVTASASGKNEDFVRRMGADEFVDYTKVFLPDYLKDAAQQSKFDHILEAVGLSDSSLYTRSDAYLSTKGSFLSVGPQPKDLSISEMFNLVKTTSAMIAPTFLGGPKACYRLIMITNNTKDLRQLQEYIAAGSLKPIVDSIFDYDDVLKAYDRLMTGKVTGKVVVKVDPSVDSIEPFH